MRFDHKKFFEGFKRDFDDSLDQGQVDGLIVQDLQDRVPSLAVKERAGAKPSVRRFGIFTEITEVAGGDYISQAISTAGRYWNEVIEVFRVRRTAVSTLVVKFLSPSFQMLSRIFTVRLIPQSSTAAHKGCPTNVLMGFAVFNIALVLFYTKFRRGFTSVGSTFLHLNHFTKFRIKTSFCKESFLSGEKWCRVGLITQSGLSGSLALVFSSPFLFFRFISWVIGSSMVTVKIYTNRATTGRFEALGLSRISPFMAPRAEFSKIQSGRHLFSILPRNPDKTEVFA